MVNHKWFTTNWDLYDKWLAVKGAIQNANSQGHSFITFWTGHAGSFPYFVASGKSSPGNWAPRLVTGLTTPGWKNSYPDFPRVACFIGICSIVFEGINILGYNFIVNNGISYMGVVFTDFIGDVVITKSIQLNVNSFTPCDASLLSQGCTYCSTATQCLGCSALNNYLFNSANSTCSAAPGYYL